LTTDSKTLFVNLEGNGGQDFCRKKNNEQVEEIENLKRGEF